MILAQAQDVIQVVNETGVDWLTPVATLLAVIVGGGITYLTQRLGRKRTEDQDAKAAARLVSADFSIVASRLQGLTTDQQWYGFFTTRVRSWPEHRGILARKLTIDEWEIVSQSAIELEHLEDGMTKALGPGGPHEGAVVMSWSSEAKQRGIRTMWKNATDAYNVLAKLGGMEHIDGLLHGDDEADAPQLGAEPR